MGCFGQDSKETTVKMFRKLPVWVALVALAKIVKDTTVRIVSEKNIVSNSPLDKSTPTFDYGQVADNYAKYRKPFPDTFFRDLQCRGLIGPGKTVLDIGAGTGMVYRKIVQIEPGCQITALDCSQGMLDTAAEQDKKLGINNIVYHCSPAEKTGLPDQHFDLIIAARCWHWFDQEAAIQEIKRICKRKATLIITHFDPALEENNPLDIVTKLIQKYDPTWKLPIKAKFEREYIYIKQLMHREFAKIELQAFVQQEFVPQSEWVNFFNTTSGIGGNSNLSTEQVRALNEEHAQMLAQTFGKTQLTIQYVLSSIFSTVPDQEPIKEKLSSSKASPNLKSRL